MSEESLTIEVGQSTVTIKKSKEEPKERKIYPINIYEGNSRHTLNKHQKYYVNLFSDFDIGGFLGTFDGCCGYAIYYKVAYDYEDIEQATEVLTKILEENKATEEGFGAVMATITLKTQLERYKDCGWTLLHEHINPLTGNTIYTIILEL